MNLLLSVMENLRTSFKYTYLTNKEFAKNIDFPPTEEIDNDGKTYFLYNLDGDKKITLLTLSKAHELSMYVKPTLYIPKTTAYMERDIHVVVNYRHLVLTPDFTLRYISDQWLLYDKYKLSPDTTHVAFYEDYCIPLSEKEAHLISKLLRVTITKMPSPDQEYSK